MRRLFKMISGLVCGLVLSSCAGMLETSPSTDVDKKVILANADAMEVAMNGVWSTMYNRIDFVTANAHQCFGNMAVTLAAELMGEDMIQTAQGAGWFWHDYNYEMRERYSSKIWRCYFTWKYFYEIISNCNYILSAEQTASGSKAQIQSICAQARAARAFAYFMLIQSYQQTYIGNETEPGVPLYTEATTSSSSGKGRGSVEQVYEQINKDIDDALELFLLSGEEQKHVSNLDYYATNLLKARVALVQNRWKDAADAAGIALQKPGRSLLSSQDATIVQGTFDNSTLVWKTGSTPFNSVASSSVLWGAEVQSDQSTVFASFYSHMDACTDVYYAAESPKCISNWLYAQIPETDVRKGWWNGNIGVYRKEWNYGANINYNQHKFQWADQKSYKGDYIFMRMEEAVLIKAEALCRLKDYDGAKATLIELMSRRDPKYAKTLTTITDSDVQTFASTGNVTTLMDEILVQRRIELWGEAGRVFDILRLKKGFTRYWTTHGELTNHENVLSKYADYLAFPADYIECILMLPQTEIDNNPNIGPEDQNPYVQ